MSLIVLQMLGVLAGVVAACIDIEAIVAAGPLLSASGVLVAVRAFRRDLACGFYLGLSAPTMSVGCFSLICGLRWSPGDAQTPVASLLVAFAVVHTALGVVSMREVRHACAGVRHACAAVRRPLQYRISTVLIVMFVLAMVLGVARTAGQVGIALSVLVAYGAAAGYVLWRFHAGHIPRECAALDWQI